MWYTRFVNQTSQIIIKVVNLCKSLDMDIPGKFQTLGRYGELFAYKYFLDKGAIVVPKFLDGNLPDWDLTVDGKRVEVKASRPSKGRYVLSFVKNKHYTSSWPKFDLALCLLIPDLDQKPIMFLLTDKDVGYKTGFGGSIDYFYRKFGSKVIS